LGDCRQHELVLCTTRSSEAQSPEAQDAFQVGKPHFDTLAIVARLLECFSASERSGCVAGTLVEAARNFANGFLRAASSLHRAWGAIPFGPAIEKRDPVIHEGAAGRQRLSS